MSEKEIRQYVSENFQKKKGVHMKKIVCDLTTEELKYFYYEEGYTLKEMCKKIGCKSDITASKILHQHGIDTNRNHMRSAKTMQGMSDEDFKKHLIYLYEEQNISLNKIAESLQVNHNALRRYFKKYNIPFKETSYAKSISSKGEKSKNWNGGKTIGNGYVLIKMPDHPNANSRGYIYEHRHIMEQHIGRYMTHDEVVHHINGNKTDNRLENLLLLTNSEHVALHAKLKAEEGNAV